MPKAWADLIEGLAMLAQHQSNDISPLHCADNRLTVMADPAMFTLEELARLENLGFTADRPEGVFISYRFGNA